MSDSIAATSRKRLGSALLAAALQAALVVVLIDGLSAPFVRLGAQRSLTSLDLRTPPPPPPPPKPATRSRTAAPAAPPAPRAQAAPFVAPPVPALKPPPVHAAAAAGQGNAPSAGAAATGNGTGAGGSGAGTGAGGEGNGDGNGGGTSAELVSARIKPSDTPDDIRNSPGKVTTRSLVLIDPRGAISGCRALGSSGNASLDLLVCRLIRERFRFRPARDLAGQAIAGQIIYEHDWEEGGGGNSDPPD